MMVGSDNHYWLPPVKLHQPGRQDTFGKNGVSDIPRSLRWDLGRSQLGASLWEAPHNVHQKHQKSVLDRSFFELALWHVSVSISTKGFTLHAQSHCFAKGEQSM